MNDIVLKIGTAGGIFAALTFTHYCVDWIPQTHKEAMVKHQHSHIRAKHCAIYAAGFIPWMYIFNFSFIEYYISLYVLFFSHFYLDTYHLVYLWAKYIRKPPEMTDPVLKKDYDKECNEMPKLYPPDPRAGFIAFANTTLGKLLMIKIDEISHIIFLWVLVYFAMN